MVVVDAVGVVSIHDHMTITRTHHTVMMMMVQSPCTRKVHPPLVEEAGVVEGVNDSRPHVFMAEEAMVEGEDATARAAEEGDITVRDAVVVVTSSRITPQ